MDTTTEGPEDRAYRVLEACERLGGISRPTLYKMAKRGEIQLHHLGGRTVVKASEIARFLNSLPDAALS